MKLRPLPRLLLLGLLVIALIVAVFLALPNDTNSGDYYVGQLADGRAITLDLELGKTNVNCAFHLEGRPELANLTGTMESNSEITAEQPGEPPREIDVKPRGSIIGKPGVFSGSLFLSNSPQALKFTATNVASRRTMQRRHKLKLGSYGGGTEYTASYPAFETTNAFLTAASRLLADSAVTKARDFNTNGYELARDNLRGHGGIVNEWDEIDTAEIFYVSSQLLSIYQEDYSYTGGAHHNIIIESRNFIFLDGKPAELQLASLFGKNKSWAKPLCAAVTRELILQQASDFAFDKSKKITVGDLTAFTLDGRGIAFHFSPYEVGSFAEGSYHVFVPWSELRPFLDTNGPLRLLPGALANR